MSRNIKLSSPWVKYYREIDALFGKDPDIKIEYNDDSNPQEIKLLVTGEEKADAIAKLLPSEKVFGNVVVKITVCPANLGNTDQVQLFRAAFCGNPAFKFAACAEGIFTNPITYVVFAKEVVQFYDDDLGDINGNCSTLYQNVAKDVFGDVKGVFFCTDKE